MDGQSPGRRSWTSRRERPGRRDWVRPVLPVDSVRFGCSELGVRRPSLRYTSLREACATLRSAIAKPVEVSSIASARTDHDDGQLGVATPMAVEATDPFGNRFLPCRCADSHPSTQPFAP